MKYLFCYLNFIYLNLKVLTYYIPVRELTRPRTSFSKRSVRWSSPLTTSQSFPDLNELPATFTFAGPSKRNVISGMVFLIKVKL